MLELAGYAARKRLRGAVALSAGLSALVALYVWLFPSVEASGVDLDEYVEAFPPAIRELFGIRALGTIEGFLAAELYGFAWVLLLGLYFAYAGASLIAADVESGRMDVLLSLPVSRTRLLLERASSLLVPAVLVNAVVPVVVLAGVALIGKSIAVADLLAVHALSLPYFAACAGIGLLASVVADRASVAQRVAAGLLFGLFLVESVVAGTAAESLQLLSPTHYYHPTDVIVDGQYHLADAAVLVVGAAAVVAASVLWFRRRDVP